MEKLNIAVRLSLTAFVTLYALLLFRQNIVLGDLMAGWSTMIGSGFQVLAVAWAARVGFAAQKAQIAVAERHEDERRRRHAMAVGAGLDVELEAVQRDIDGLLRIYQARLVQIGRNEEGGEHVNVACTPPGYILPITFYQANLSNLGGLGPIVTAAVMRAYQAAIDLNVYLDPRGERSDPRKWIEGRLQVVESANALVRDARLSLRAAKVNGASTDDEVIRFNSFQSE